MEIEKLQIISMKEKLVYTVLMYSLFFAAYLTANRIIDLKSCHDLSLPLDQALPFIPAFIFPYCFIYLFTMLPTLVVTERWLYLRTVLGCSILIISSATIFLLFPVLVPRPPQLPDGFFGWAYNTMFYCDKPVCGFPSLHVGLTTFATLVIFKVSRRWGVFCMLIAIITVFSTLLTKQHVILDAAGGLFMSFLVYFLVMYTFVGKKIIPKV